MESIFKISEIAVAVATKYGVDVKQGDDLVLLNNDEAKKLRNFLNQLDLGE